MLFTITFKTYLKENQTKEDDVNVGRSDMGWKKSISNVKKTNTSMQRQYLYCDNFIEINNNVCNNYENT